MKAVILGFVLVTVVLAADFARFEVEYGRQYATSQEREMRKHIFEENMKKAAEMQAKNPLAVFGVNKFADLTAEEFNQHTVKPWFNGKLDFSPPVQDLASQGFPLIGGRLDYLAGRPVAALVYRRQQHVINLFIWPSAGETTDTGVATETRQGYNVAHWTQAGMTYWAITDLNATEFQQFVQRLTTATHG